MPSVSMCAKAGKAASQQTPVYFIMQHVEASDNTRALRARAGKATSQQTHVNLIMEHTEASDNTCPHCGC